MRPDTRGTAVVGPATDTARAVYEDIVRFGPRPRTELAARLELSGPTLTRVTRALLDDSLLRELAPVPQPKGRPQEPLDVDEDHARFIGVKVTADSVYAAVTTVRGVVHEDLSETLATSDPDVVIAAILDLAGALLRAHPRVAGVGVSLGAVVPDGRRALRSRLLGWSEPVDLGSVLEDALEVPVTVANDIAALLLGIAWFGLGRSVRTLGAVTIGAGVAVGTIHEGQVMTGIGHRAGVTEVLPTRFADGAPTTLGEAAQTEQVLARARRCGVLGPRDGIPELLAIARTGDQRALEVVRDTASAVAVAIATLVAVADPGAVIVGGEDAPLLAVPGSGFEETLRALLPDEQRDLPLRKLSVDFDEWARGAAAIAIRSFIRGDG
ncbi:ROK family protein [Brachybacterium huguangmaarense]|uniref:ROK family protein n=1 Tax=Brachybacterium huguangmaarense TaxID=1652028 RepID=A0ABY6G1Z4_9MICO|nr:ROK family protein [Brachybacterium huguangmaarense]UYG17228.1 ROK family protein [Brachybacterium huguangmaarense]